MSIPPLATFDHTGASGWPVGDADCVSEGVLDMLAVLLGVAVALGVRLGVIEAVCVKLDVADSLALSDTLRVPEKLGL